MSLRCFVENLRNAAAAGSGCVVRLSEPEAKHARLSRRLEVGDSVAVFDGKGAEAQGTIAVASRSAVEVTIGKLETRVRPRPALTLAIAMPKGPRQDVLIEKCTELGVARIQPIVVERSVAGVSEHKLDKWRRTTIEAAKQSGQCWLPELSPPTPIARFLTQMPSCDFTLAGILPDQGEPTPISDLVGRIQTAETVLAFVGPEGGWTQAESDALLAAGATAVSLGPNVLRIETAAMALAVIAHACSH